MEEKERYRLIGFDTSQGLVDKIYDTKKDIIICNIGDADDVGNVIDLLNQQDKENQQLKQQLNDLPKEIVEEIKNELLPEFSGPQDYEEKYHILTVKILDTILKKYGGK